MYTESRKRSQMVRKIKTNTLAEQAYVMLKNDIRHGVLVPGQRLAERLLTESMAISRTPIRQALQRLEAEQYLKRLPNGGYSVSQLRKEDILHLYLIRIELETLAIEWAVKKCDEAGIRELKKMLAKMIHYGELGEMDKVATYNSMFHRVISSLSGSQMLVEIIDSLKNRIQNAILKGLMIQGAMEDSMREHREIIEAMHRKETETAKRLIRVHLKRSMTVLLAHI